MMAHVWIFEYVQDVGEPSANSSIRVKQNFVLQSDYAQLEAERDALMNDIGHLLHGDREGEAIARSNLYDKFTEWAKANQALTNGGYDA